MVKYHSCPASSVEKTQHNVIPAPYQERGKFQRESMPRIVIPTTHQVRGKLQRESMPRIVIPAEAGIQRLLLELSSLVYYLSLPFLRLLLPLQMLSHCNDVSRLMNDKLILQFRINRYPLAKNPVSPSLIDQNDR